MIKRSRRNDIHLGDLVSTHEGYVDSDKVVLYDIKRSRRGFRHRVVEDEYGVNKRLRSVNRLLNKLDKWGHECKGYSIVHH